MKHPDPTKMIACESGHLCERRLTKSEFWGKVGSYTCSKPAVWTDGQKHYCNKHSLKGRFVFRDGPTGEVVARFDTMDELQANKEAYNGYYPQYMSATSRRSIVL